MSITLRKIDENNWRECIHLNIREDQKRFVATNENGLALAYVHKEMNPRGVYLDNALIGFLMYAQDPDDGIYYINRFMIDEKYQGKGFGRKALENLICQLKQEGVERVEILHKPDNIVAISLYESLGFKLTDGKLDDDVISNLDINGFINSEKE